MKRVGSRRARRVDQLIDPKVAFRCLIAANPIGLVGQPHVQRVAIAIGIDGYTGEPHVAARPDNPHGDLAAVGD